MRSTVLTAVAAKLATEPDAARGDLQRALAEARGPLVQRIPGTDRVVVTFVVVGRKQRPYVLCALFKSDTEPFPMQPVPGADDVWWAEAETRSDVTTVYQYLSSPVMLGRDDVADMHDDDALRRYVLDRYAASLGDPLNPLSRMPAVYLDECEPGSGGPRPEKRDAVLLLPDTPPYRWHDPVPDRGTTHHRRFTSRTLSNVREVAVWTPPGYHAADGAGLHTVVLFDGDAFETDTMQADLIFANLVLGGHLPPFAAVLVGNATEYSRAQELPCNPATADFVADELLPALRTDFDLASDPARVAVGGFSYGGLAADWLGFCRPDAFGNVLSLSASLWWGRRPPGADPRDLSLGRDDRPEWLIRQYTASPVKPLRFWVDVGLLEDEPVPGAGGITQLSANRRFHAVLLEKGYEVAGYREQPGAHDLDNWRRTLPDGLIALFGNVSRT